MNIAFIVYVHVLFYLLCTHYAYFMFYCCHCKYSVCFLCFRSRCFTLVCRKIDELMLSNSYVNRRYIKLLVSCILYLVSCILYLVSCILYLVSCILYLVVARALTIIFIVHLKLRNNEQLMQWIFNNNICNKW